MHIQWPRSRAGRAWWRWRLILTLLLVGAGGRSLPAHAGTSTGIVSIRVPTGPTLLALDPDTHQV